MDDPGASRRWLRSTQARLRRSATDTAHNGHSTPWERWQFFSAFLREPLSVGALAPSSPELARAVLAGCNLTQASTVVELGPGTGAFTRLILDQIGAQTTFFALELDPRHVRRLQHRFPSMDVYHDSAENIHLYLARHHRQSADCIISGLPWGNMSRRQQDRLTRAVFTALKPGGVFTTFAYLHALWLPGAQHFRTRLKEHFTEVNKSHVVWRNLPPAFVYRCR